MAFPLASHGPTSPDDGVFRFDKRRADRAQAFFEQILTHTKGRYAGKPFALDEWQCEGIVRPIFGTVMYDSQYGEWVRQYRLAWIELGRKNGKSEILSALALMFLCADDEESAEVYSVAADKDQAALVFNVAKRMVELSPILSKRLEIIDSRKMIVDPKTNSVYKVLPGDAAGALGTNPSAVLFDEVLTQKDRHLWDAMRQGFGTRKQPIMIAATTAAYTSAKFALEEHKYSERVLENPELDPSRFVFMRNCPQDWDWQDEGQPANPETGEPATGWYWSNPALGTFLNVNNLRAEAKEAAEKPQAQNAFRVFRLNQWTGQENRWLDMSLWKENGEIVAVDEEALKGRECVGGLDLASVSDFTAWVLVFKGSPTDPAADGVTILPRFFIPRPAVEKRSEMAETFAAWEREGVLTVTSGQATQYDVIENQISEDASKFKLRAFGYDPWNAAQLVQNLESRGMLAIKVPQFESRLTEPCKRVESLLAERELWHGNNPVLSWMADNVELKVSGDGKMRPDKAKSGEKIDGIAAMLNALFVAAVPVPDEPDVTFIDFSSPELEDDSPSLEDEPDELDYFLKEWMGAE